MLKKFALFAAAALVSSGSGMAAEPQISDAQIAHIAYTAGQLDVDTAKLALERSRDATIRAFAETWCPIRRPPGRAVSTFAWTAGRAKK